jgi:hypothetical protein
VSDTTAPKKLIPTRRRDKLRRRRSYAVGAELISEALAGTPQFEELSISFRHKSWLEGTVSITYDSTAATWRIEVSSVPSEIRSAVRRFLVATGLPALRAWLLTPRPGIWYDRDHKLRVSCWGQEPQSSIGEFEKARNEIHWPIMPVCRFGES